MRVEIDYKGKTYVSKNEEGVKAEDVAEDLYELADEMVKFKIGLEDGSFLILGKEATRLAVFRFID